MGTCGRLLCHGLNVSFTFHFRVLVMGDGEILEFDCPDTLLKNKESHFYKLAHKELY